MQINIATSFNKYDLGNNMKSYVHGQVTPNRLGS